MDDFEIEFQPDEEVAPAPKEFANPVYKKWFKAGGNAGFISIEPWLAGQKFVVDIGKVDPNTNKVVSSTKCWVNAVLLVNYLNLVNNDKGKEFFPPRGDCPSPESFVSYGGSGSPPVARVFKVHWWGAKKDSEGDPKGFAWKCGHFKGVTTNTGAIKPQYDSLESADLIKVSRLEMQEIGLRLNVSLNGYAAKFNDWYG